MTHIYVTLITLYLDCEHWLAAVSPGSAGSCGSVRGAPPVCSAACSYGHSNYIYMASLQWEKTLGTEKADCIIIQESSLESKLDN